MFIYVLEKSRSSQYKKVPSVFDPLICFHEYCNRVKCQICFNVFVVYIFKIELNGVYEVLCKALLLPVA